MSAPADALLLPETSDARDLEQFLTRAASVRDGVVRIVARGQVAAFHVAAAFPLMLGASSPTLIGQRGVRLTTAAQLDVVVPIAEVRDRLARLIKSGEAPAALEIPPSRPNAPWTATVPLSAAWEPSAPVHDDAWVESAREVASLVQEALPADPGQPVVFQARDAVWGQERPELGEGVCAGAPFLAHAYGFLRSGSRSQRFSSGTWERLSSAGGTLLWRNAA